MKAKNTDTRRLILIGLIAMMIVVCVVIYFQTQSEPLWDQKKPLSDFNRNLKSSPTIVNVDCKVAPNPLDEARNCALVLKQRIECNWYKDFYSKGKRIKGEKFLQELFALTFVSLHSHVDSEPNNGSGCADFIFSQGSQKKAVVELKLASNPNLPHGLTSQVERYKNDINTDKALYIIAFFTKKEGTKLDKILTELGMDNDPNVIRIDGRKKTSASRKSIT